MSRPMIGFAGLDRPWEYPVTGMLVRFSEQTRTVRYKHAMRERVFDLYAPKFLLAEATGEKSPERICVTIGRTRRQIGFHPNADSAARAPGVLHYHFAADKVNSKRYNVTCGHQRYSLYIPNEVFGDKTPPEELFICITKAD